MQDENAFATKKSTKTFGVQPVSQFSVFVDEPSKPAVKETKAKNIEAALPEAVTSVPSTRQALSEVPCSPDLVCLEDTTGSEL